MATQVAIPFVTALGDLLGTASLNICFIVLAKIASRAEMGGD